MTHSNAAISVRDGDIPGALKRLKAALTKSGVLRAAKDKQFYISPSRKRKLKSIRSRKLKRRGAQRIARAAWRPGDDAA